MCPIACLRDRKLNDDGKSEIRKMHENIEKWQTNLVEIGKLRNLLKNENKF